MVKNNLEELLFLQDMMSQINKTGNNMVLLISIFDNISPQSGELRKTPLMTVSRLCLDCYIKPL